MPRLGWIISREPPENIILPCTSDVGHLFHNDHSYTLLPLNKTLYSPAMTLELLHIGKHWEATQFW